MAAKLFRSDTLRHFHVAKKRNFRLSLITENINWCAKGIQGLKIKLPGKERKVANVKKTYELI